MELTKILIRGSEPRMLTKVNPKAKSAQISNLEPQILKRILNLIITTLLI